VEYKRYDPDVVVVHAKGGDKWRNRKKSKKQGRKRKEIEFLVSRGVDDKHKSSAMLSAVKPDLSSTAIRQHLTDHPGELGVRDLVKRGWLSAAVAAIMIARASVLRVAVPRLFDSLSNVEGACRDAGHGTERAKDAPKTALSSSTSKASLATTKQTNSEVAVVVNVVTDTPVTTTSSAESSPASAAATSCAKRQQKGKKTKVVGLLDCCAQHSFE